MCRGCRRIRWSSGDELFELVRTSGKPLSEVARDIGVSEPGLRNWVMQADIDGGHREGLTSDEREELVRLRREVRVLKMERDLLSGAAAFLAKENVLFPGP